MRRGSAATLRAPPAARLRAAVRACDDAVDDDAAEEGADPFELPVMKMKRLVTPAQAGYERMRERQKQRRALYLRACDTGVGLALGHLSGDGEDRRRAQLHDFL